MKNNLLPINQTSDTGDNEWDSRSCGICVLKMLMVFKKPEIQSVPIMTLLNQALEMSGYIDGIGWRHQALADLAAKYGVELGFQKFFFDTPDKKKEGIKIVNNKLRSGEPVAVSVLKEFDIPKTAHLVVVAGFSKIWFFVWGYKIIDSYSGRRGNIYSVSKKEFLAGWRGGLIYFKN